MKTFGFLDFHNISGYANNPVNFLLKSLILDALNSHEKVVHSTEIYETSRMCVYEKCVGVC